MITIKCYCAIFQLGVLFLLTAGCISPASAILECTSLQVSTAGFVPPLNATAILTLYNSDASTAIIVKPDLTVQQLSDKNNWHDISSSIYVKPNAANPWQIAPGKYAVFKFHLQFFHDTVSNAEKSTFQVTPHISYFLQRDNLLPLLTDDGHTAVNWQVENPAAGFNATTFVSHDNDVQMHVNNNLLKSRLTLYSGKSTFAAGEMYLAGILNKSDRAGWDSPLNKGVSVIEHDDSGAIRAHPLHVFEVPFWNWELMRFTAAKNTRKTQMEIWLRGWQLHQTGDWWIKNAFIVPQERIKVLSTVLSGAPKNRHRSERATATEESSKVFNAVSRPGDSFLRLRSGRASSFRMTSENNLSSVIYLGEDRATRGDWRGAYGNESFILCGMQAPQDVVGGRLLPKRYYPTGKKAEVHTAGVWSSWQGVFHYSVETGDPKEPVRHYIPPHQLNAGEKRALINPLEGGRRYSSWDDHGETHPFDGKGPDLLVHLDVPKGLHKLSFYFVDWDFANTFRPRAHRIFIEEDNGASTPLSDQAPAKVLSSAYVSHFGDGVYKIFAVRGPCKLRVRITKDASVCAVLSGIFLDEINPKVPLLKGGLLGIFAAPQGLLSPQTKLSTFAAYIKNNPPANLAESKARVQHLLDKGEIGLARLAVPAWLHRAAAQSPATEISTYREAVTMFALRDSDYASDLAQQLVRHVVARGGSKVLLLKIGKELMQFAELHQQGTLRSRAAYPVVVAYYRRLQGEFGIKGLGEEGAFHLTRAIAESGGYHHGRERRAIIEYQKYTQQWTRSIYAIRAHQKIIQLANVLCVPVERNARRYASIAANSARALTKWLSENKDMEQISPVQNDSHRELYFAVKQSVNQFAALSSRIEGKAK